MFHFARGSGRVDMFKWPYADGVAIASVVCLTGKGITAGPKKLYKRRPQNTHTNSLWQI